MTMGSEIAPRSNGSGFTLPAIIADAGDHAARRFVEFFTATIRHANTRLSRSRNSVSPK
jgi:hypothetical protein